MEKAQHLSLFAVNRTTGRPVTRLPVYAEIGVPLLSTEPPPQLDPRLQEVLVGALQNADPSCAADPACKSKIITALSAVLAQTLASGRADRLVSDNPLASKLLNDLLRAARKAAGVPLIQIDVAKLPQLLESALRAVAPPLAVELVAPADGTGPVLWAYPLGVLATDHVGYLSFDLSRLPAAVVDAVSADVQARKADPTAIARTTVSMFPLLPGTAPLNALSQARFTDSVILAQAELDDMVLPPSLDNLGMLSMQSPDLSDWRLSPASFAVNPATLVGQDGCESLLPANVALQEFFFYQVVRLNQRALGQNPVPPGDLRNHVRVGVIHEYRIAWYPLGHSLGGIQYSLPLAPGESVNLAVVDWTRRDDAQRAERSTIDEQLVHDEHRDRTITETVNAAVQEYQKGSSFMAGAALSSGLSAALGSSVGLAAGLAGSLGGSSADSSGSRNIAANTVQNLSDNITQASADKREFHSTVVVQSVQAEKENIQTRTVVNYNHSHALTILYYEVLRHFRVVTERVRSTAALLVDYEVKPFKPLSDLLTTNRAVIKAALLDPKFASSFDALDRVIERNRVPPPPPPPPGPPPTPLLRFFNIDLKTGGMYANVKDHSEANVDVFATLLPKGIKLNDGGKLNTPGSFTQPNTNNAFSAWLPPTVGTVAWGDLDSISFTVDVFKGDEDWANVSFSHVRVMAIDVDGNEIILIDKDYSTDPYVGHIIMGNDGAFLLPTKRAPTPPPPAGIPADQIADQVAVDDLLDHLDQHREFYNRIVWLSEDPLKRAARFDATPWDGSSSLLDHLDNRAVEVIGTWVAFPTSDDAVGTLIQSLEKSDEREVEGPSDILNERLITLPARGVFAEAKLGHCNASELIDNTRFWDWQTSPIPHLAPDIAPVSAVTPQPQQANTQPSPFPTSLLNIVNPPAAPDPTGLAAALNVLGTPNLFRDMSGEAQVDDLLKKLSDNSINIAQAANAARQIQKAKAAGGTSTGGTAAGVLAGASGFGARATPTQPAAATRDLGDLRTELQQGVNSGLLTPDQASSSYTNVADRLSAGQPLLAFQASDAAVAATATATSLDLTPIRTEESGELLATYQLNRFLIFVPLGAIGPDSVSSTKVHVFFAAGGVAQDRQNDVLIHGLRAASNYSDWITIAVPGITDAQGNSLANPISDKEIAACLQSVGVSGDPTALRLTGHSRGCIGLVASLTPSRIANRTIIDRVVFLDEAVEHGRKDTPNEGAVVINRVAIVAALGIDPGKIFSYEVNNKSLNTKTGASARVAGANYVDLSTNCMGAIGCVRLIGDAIALNPAIAAAVTANTKITNQLATLLLPARGSFTTKGLADAADLNQFCQDHAPAISAIFASASKAGESVSEFVNQQDLMRYAPQSFGWGILAHHLFVAEIAQELFD